ncbi:MAG: glycosyltransferase family 4 protein [Spirochaetota bacterium]|nr:glycosyltransferase family 4 protein [Spirochaetota bacterium]
MKILFDNQIFTWQKYGGVSRYFYEIMNQFYRKEIDFVFPMENIVNQYVLNSSFYKEAKQKNYKETKQKKSYFKTILKHFLYKPFPGKGILLKLYGKSFPGKLLFTKHLMKIHTDIQNQYVQFFLQMQEFDIFHPTYYDPYFLNYLDEKPFVLTVYDMIHQIFPEYFMKDDMVIKWKKSLIEKASKVIAISENTKQDIIRLFGINESKIEVIYLGNSLNPKNNDSSLSIPEKYILFVGNRSIYKNFNFFITSISSLFIKDPSLNLICVGGGPISKEEKDLFCKLKISNNVSYYPFLEDDNLVFLYKNALAFVFPSLYEGFGLPILEAFACQCPVISSNTSSLPEIAGEAAIYFDPKDDLSIKQAIEKVIYNNDLRNNLKNLGKVQLKKFSWEKTAQETLQLYQSLI